MLKVTCDCGRRFQVAEQEAGKRGVCPCGQVVQIPGPPLSDTVSLAGLEYETSTSLEWPSDGIGSPQARDSIGPYALVRKLGEGAMGEVWLARDEHLDREVAIKFLHAHVSRDQDQLRRFMREAKLMAKLDHPHVVRVIHLGNTGDHLYLVIEYVRGGSLEDHVRETGPLPWREATRAIRDAASGLAEAHRQELIHRDIKPANLLRTPDGKTKVSDFGLVRHLTQGSELTHHGTVMGSGARTGMGIIRREWSKIQRGRGRARIRWFGAGAGATLPGTRVRRTRTGTTRRTGTAPWASAWP